MKNIIFKALVGSHAYGTNVDRGFFLSLMPKIRKQYEENKL